MKKSVALLVTAALTIAIVFVAVFGTKPQGIVPIIYIESLTIKPSETGTFDEEEKSLVLAYDESKAVEYEFDGEVGHYMSYIFQTVIAPDSATSRSFRYWVADNKFVFFPTETASKQGSILIKEPQNPAKTKFFPIEIHVDPNDGGAGKGDTINLIVDYRSLIKE